MSETWDHYLAALAHARKQRDKKLAKSAQWFLLAIFIFLGFWLVFGFEVAMLSFIPSGVFILHRTNQEKLSDRTALNENYNDMAVEHLLLSKVAQGVAPWLNFGDTPSPEITAVTNSKLINGAIEFLNGNRSLYGECEGRRSITATYIEAGYYGRLKKSDGSIHKYDDVKYKGLFITMSFPRVKKGWVMLKTDNLESLEWLSNEWRSAMTTSYIRLDNPEFEKYFNVLASNQQEGFEILSSSVMEALVNFAKKKFDLPLTLTFRNEKMFALMPMSISPFELRNNEALWKSELQRYEVVVQAVASLFELLNSNNINGDGKL